jgi:Zn-dependent protease with chaperone function
VGIAAAAGLAALLAIANPLERERRAEDASAGALIKDGWRVRLASAQVAEDFAIREYESRVRDYAQAGVLDSDAYLTELVGSVVTPLIVAANDLYPQTREWAWDWHVADTGEVNAYCLPGGRIVVLTGLLSPELLDDDRDRLATILAHEVSHAILQHSREAMGRGQVAQGLAWTVAKSLKIGALREGQMIATLKTALLDPRNRAHETEADVLGLELMTRAGFAPAKAVETWERMAERLSPEARTPLASRALAFLSDHPSDLERLARMKALQPKARPLAEQAKHWDWLTQGMDDTQVEALSRAANAFGLDRLEFTSNNRFVRAVASAEKMSAKQAAAEIERSMWETGLDQGGALQMALTAMVRGAGGWDVLARVEKAWRGLRNPRPLLQDPAQIKRMALSDADRGRAIAAIQRVQRYLAAPRFQRRLWRDTADELGKTRPKARQAIQAQLEAQP